MGFTDVFFFNPEKTRSSRPPRPSWENRSTCKYKSPAVPLVALLPPWLPWGHFQGGCPQALGLWLLLCCN